jgi:hypothetical protein
MKAAPKDVCELLIDDPVFESVFDLLDEEDKMEFPDVKKALRNRKVRHRIQDFSQLRRKRKQAAAGLSVASKKKRRRLAQAAAAKAKAKAAPAPISPAGGGGGSVVGTPPPYGGDATPPADGGDATPILGGNVTPPFPLLPPLPPPMAAPLEPKVGRGIAFGSKFILAEHHPRGVFRAWTATCNMHTAEGERCNKNLNFGEGMSPDEACRRIKAWCLLAADIPNEVGGKVEHMKCNPRHVAPEDVPTHEEADAMLPGLGLD